MKRLGIVSIAATVGATVACGGGAGDEDQLQPALPACEPAQGILPHDFNVAGLAGQYTLRLYATSGDSAGRDVSGSLTLMEHADDMKELTVPSGAAMRTIATPLYGTAEIGLSAVNAVTQGSLGSTDPMMPGAVVLERHTDPGLELTVRLGSQLNRRSQTQFDGAYTAMTVNWGSGDRFGGSWSSGLMGSGVEGYFCADRVAASD